MIIVEAKSQAKQNDFLLRGQQSIYQWAGMTDVFHLRLPQMFV